jgi:hypothetical protein
MPEPSTTSPDAGRAAAWTTPSAGAERSQLSRPRLLIGTLALLALAAAAFYQGVWAQLAPRSFYEDFPAGLNWLAGSGPYNEHLIRDVGGLVNGLGVVAVVAAVTRSRTVLVATALAWLVYGLPHLAFHLDHPLPEGPMQALNAAVLVSEVALPVIGLLALWSLVPSRPSGTDR